MHFAVHMFDQVRESIPDFSIAETTHSAALFTIARLIVHPVNP